MAEEQHPDLSTDTKRVEHFNKKVEEFKKESPDTAEVSKEAFDIARQYAQQSVFPPFGIIAFPEDSKKHTPDEMGIGIAAGNVLFGASRFINSLKKDTPETLIEKGIDTYKGFDDSVAVNSLAGSTKMSFAEIREGMSIVNAAIRADDKDVEDPFEDNVALKKLTPDEIDALLESTVIKFVKELGLKRNDDSDKPYLESGESALAKIPAQAAVETTVNKTLDPTKLNTKDDPEYMARLEKAKREDELMDSLMGIKTDKKEPAENAIKQEEVKPIATVQTPAETNPPVSQIAPKTEVLTENKSIENNVIDKTQTSVTNNVTSVTSPQQSVTNVTSPKESITNITSTQQSVTNVTPQQSAVKTEEAPVIKTESSQSPLSPLSPPPPVPSELMSQSSISSGNSPVSDEETPLLKMLGESTGMSADEIAKMFASNPEGLNTGLDLTFAQENIQTSALQESPQAISRSVQESITQEKEKATSVIQQSITEPVASIKSAATKVSEPIKMAAAAEPPAASTPPETQPVVTTSPEVSTEAISQTQTGADSSIPPASETKPAESTTNIEQGQTNDELLRVMKEVLKTLQGPLIFTDSSPRFS